MAIFPDPVKTPEEIAKEQVLELNALVERTVCLCKSFSEKMYNKFWNNPLATPMAMSAIYGASAYQLFVKLTIFNESIKGVDPSYVVPTIPEKYTYVINQDGTVTITEVIPSSSSSMTEVVSSSSSSVTPL